MTIAYWATAIPLAALFAMAGLMKSTQPIDTLKSKGLAWVEDFSPRTVRFIGTVELLGAIGLIVPPLVEIAPVLAPVAAVGLALTMALAARMHLGRKEPITFNVALGLLAVAVAVLGFLAWV